MVVVLSKKNTGKVYGEKLMAYGDVFGEGTVYFIYVPAEKTVDEFLSSVHQGLLKKFLHSTQKALDSKNDIDTVYNSALRSRRIGKIFGIGEIDKCMSYAMCRSLTDYVRNPNHDQDKLNRYYKEFKI